MFLKRKRRFERMAEARGDRPRKVSDSQLFAKMGYTPEEVN
ncbi:MAG TPA: hypothetical protein VN622_10920 [Clostridia bacterium]|nr:hypothetical protein [Clostridia bacterium]